MSRRLFPPSEDSQADAAVQPPADLPTVEEVLAARPTGRGDWDRRAACSSGEHDPELWWPVGQIDPAVEARRVCGGCPVIGDCRDAFLARPGDRDGIWARLRGHELLKAARQAAPTAERLTRLTKPTRQPTPAPSRVPTTGERTGGPTRGMR